MPFAHFIPSNSLRFHGPRKDTGHSQSDAVLSSHGKGYFHTVFRSKLTNEALTKHGDFSAAIAKESQRGILKVRPLQQTTDGILDTFTFSSQMHRPMQKIIPIFSTMQFPRRFHRGF
jgi:hypothetical protein